MLNINSFNIILSNIISIISSWWFITFTSAFLIFIIMIIILIMILNNDKRYRLSHLNESNVRIFSYNYETETLFRIDKTRLKNHSQNSIHWLINSFAKKDQKRLVTWLNELKKENSIVPLHFSGDIKISKSGKTCYNVLEVTSINHEKKIIHFESRLFNFSDRNRLNKRYKVSYKGFNELLDIYSDNPSLPKTLYLIKLFNKKNDIHSKSVNHNIMSHITFNLVPFLNENSAICIIKDNEIMIVDYDKYDKKEVYHLAKKIEEILQRTLSVSSILNSFTGTIGVLNDNNNEFNLIDAFSMVQKMADYGHDNQLGSNIVIYDKENDYSNKDLSNIISSVRSIIRYNNISIKYLPIYDVKYKKVNGLDTDLVINNDKITSSKELQEIAASNDVLLQKLLLDIIKKIDHPFEEKAIRTVDSYYVLIDTKIDYYQSIINTTLDYTSPKKLFNIFTFTDTNIIEDLDYAFSAIKKLQDNKIRFALKITNIEVPIPDYILDTFSIYIVDMNYFPEVTPSNNIIFLDLINRLQAHKKRIHVLNISSWSLIETLIKFGVRYVSSELFGNSINEIPSIDEKKANKINNYTK